MENLILVLKYTFLAGIWMPYYDIQEEGIVYVPFKIMAIESDNIDLYSIDIDTIFSGKYSINTIENKIKIKNYMTLSELRINSYNDFSCYLTEPADNIDEPEGIKIRFHKLCDTKIDSSFQENLDLFFNKSWFCIEVPYLIPQGSILCYNRVSQYDLNEKKFIVNRLKDIYYIKHIENEVPIALYPIQYIDGEKIEIFVPVLRRNVILQSK